MPIKLENVRISSAHTGIKSDGPVDLDLKNVTFSNVQVPLDIAGAKSVNIRGSRVTDDPKPRRKIPPTATRNIVGWRRVNGPPLPVFCSSCKTIFPSRNYIFGGMYFNCWDNEEQCPECGDELAKLSEGVFDLTKATIQILSAPDITYAIILALRDLLNDIETGNIDPEQVVKRANALNPAIGALLTKYLRFGYGAIMLVATVVAAIYAERLMKLRKKKSRLALSRYD